MSYPHHSIAEWQRDIHQWAIEKGFWPTEGRNTPEILALIHSEVSEALEAWRQVDCDVTEIRYRDDGKPEGFAVELADIVIRVLDLAESIGVDLEEVIALKHAYNQGRPYRHGKRA